jgi:zinc protease
MTIRYAAWISVLIAFGASSGFAAGQSAPVLPEISSKHLMNQLDITVASTPNSRESMTIGMVLRYGSAFDPADKTGIANVVTRMLGRATLDRTAKDIREELNVLGATLDVQTSWDGIRLVLHGNSSTFERSLLLLHQIVAESQFTPEDLAAVKQEILQNLQHSPDPRQRLRGQFETVLYRSTTYARPLQGTKASIDGITIGDVRVFYRRYFSPDAAALVVVGSVPPPIVLQKASRIWGVWVRKEEVPFTFLNPRPPSSRSVFLEDDPGSPAAQFILGNLWPRREDDSFYAAELAARVFQERLTKALPTSLLTVSSEGRRMAGPFLVQGQAAAEEATGEIQKIIEIAETMKSSGVTAQELADAKSRWIGEFEKSLGSTDGLCDAMLDAELYRLGTNYVASFSDLVRRNDADSVKETTRQWIFPGGLVALVRGPSAALKPALQLLGPLQQLVP